MATSSSGSGSSQQSAVSSPTLMSVLDDPRLSSLFNTIQGVTPTSLPSLDSIVNEGMNSPLMSQIISGALKRAAPNEALARQGVTDAARASGGLRGTAYMQGVARNEGNILDQRGILTSDIIAKTLQQLISGRLQEQQNSFLPARTLTDLFQAGRPLSGQTSSSQSTSQWGQQGSGDGMTEQPSQLSYEDWQARLAGYPNAAAHRASQSNISSPPPNMNNPPGGAPAPNPYGGYGFPPGAGGAPTYATGGSPYGDYNFQGNQGGPEYGPWSPTTYGQPDTGYTSQPGIFQNFPAPVNPYAGWEPAEPVPWVSEGEY